MKKSIILTLIFAVVITCMLGSCVFSVFITTSNVTDGGGTQKQTSSSGKLPVTTNWSTDQTISSKLNNPISAILTVVSVIAGAVAVGMLIYIGIKYMTKGAGGKAEVKDTLLPYLIGAILVGGAATLAQVAINMGQTA